MTGGSRGEILWSVAAEIGGFLSTSATGPTQLRAPLQRLGALCDATADLWLSTDAAPSARLEPTLTSPDSPPETAVLATQAALEWRTLTAPLPAPTLALPLIAGGSLHGVLILRARQAVSALPGWQHALEEFAPLLGALLSTLRREPANRDRADDRAPLAGIAQGEALWQHFRRELSRARRTRRNLAVLTVGLDRYADFGQRWDDPTQERLMNSLAAIIHGACRDIDLIGRHSADQFVLLLAESTSDGARIAARRYLHHIHRHPALALNGEHQYLDTSIGIALFPVDGVTTAELLASATAALHEARRLGGNRTAAA
ncbi:MAG: GGDEF domain-containing protein [Thermomicrobiales bacterium]